MKSSVRQNTTNVGKDLSIVVIGADGQLGFDLVRILQSSHRVTALTHADLDITSRDQIVRVIEKAKPELVINAAAYNKVEDAEIDPTQAYLINAVGPYLLAKELSAMSVPFLHVSTDYVFDGENTQGYVEDSIPHPINAYGSSKAEGEELVRIATDAHWIVRTTGLFGLHSGGGKGYNFVTRMRELGKTGVVSVFSD